MVVKFKDDYLKAIEGMNPLIRKNGAYNLNFEYVVEDRLHAGALLDVEVFNDGKAVRLIDYDTSNLNIGFNVSTVTDIYLLNDDGIEVLKSRGDLADANGYYGRPSTGAKPSDDIQTVLNVSYNRSVYDKDGIEMINESYFKGGIPCGSAKLEDNDSIVELILSAGNIMPIFYGEEVEIPTNSANSILDIYIRDDENPAIATRTRVERGKTTDLDDYAITNSSMGFINSPWPELLSIPSGETFADNIDGEWTIRKESIRSGYDTVEEIVDACTHMFREQLENSNTKRLNLKEYDALKEKIELVIKNKEDSKTR